MTADRVDIAPSALDLELAAMRDAQQRMIDEALADYPRMATQHRLLLRIVIDEGSYEATDLRVARLGGWSRQRAKVLLGELEHYGWLRFGGPAGPFWQVRTPDGPLPDVHVTMPAVAGG